MRLSRRTAPASAASGAPASRWSRPGERTRPDRALSEIRSRIITGTLLAAGAAAALLALDRVLLAVLVAAVLAAAGSEWARLCGLGARAAALYAAGALAAFGALFWIGDGVWAFAAAAVFWMLVAPLWLWRGIAFRHARWLAASGFVVLIPAALALVFLPPREGLAVLGLVWIGDVAAYAAGSAFGRRRLAPSISPGKTWEGAGAALLAALAYAIIWPAVVPHLAERLSGGLWPAYLGGAALLCAAGVAGDLFESAAKRQASVKDSGSLLPGHGGILDRIDSATSTLPLAALLVPWILRP
jgi:phosphatidate cytidylyltransferase